MTALEARVSRASQMIFHRVGLYVKQSNEGYVIRAEKIQGRWCFLVLSPEIKVIRGGRSMSLAGLEYKSHYAIGDEVPPAYSYKSGGGRLYLGCYREVDYGSPEAARAAAEQACIDHLNASQPQVVS